VVDTASALHSSRLDVRSVVDRRMKTPLGIIFQKKFYKAYSVLGIIKRNFIYMDERTFTLLYKSMVAYARMLNLQILFGARIR